MWNAHRRSANGCERERLDLNWKLIYDTIRREKRAEQSNNCQATAVLSFLSSLEILLFSPLQVNVDDRLMVRYDNSRSRPLSFHTKIKSIHHPTYLNSQLQDKLSRYLKKKKKDLYRFFFFNLGQLMGDTFLRFSRDQGDLIFLLILYATFLLLIRANNKQWRLSQRLCRCAAPYVRGQPFY